MKRLLILLSLLLSVPAFASMNQSDVMKVLKGRYQLDSAGETLNFVIRSKGTILMLASTIDYVEGELQFTGSSNSIGPDGLPIANIILANGSDEETRDFHLLLTVEQDWSGNNHEIKLITVFSTFNDGPNDYSSYEGQYSKPSLKKYNKKTKKYEVIK